LSRKLLQDVIKTRSNGALSKCVNEYSLKKASETKALGLAASEADFEWKTFQQEEETLVKTIVAEHPGGQHDQSRLAQANFTRQATRFKKWLAADRG
jgi:hypothetical protein